MNVLSGFGSGSSRNIVIRFIADTARAGRSIDSLLKRFEKARVGVQAGDTESLRRGGFGGVAGRPIYNFLDSLNQSSGSLASFALKLGVAAVAVGTFISAMRAAFKHGAFLEGSKIIFETLTGSERKASRLLREARRYSVLTPFEPEEVVGAATVATQYGIDPFRKGAYGLGKNKNAMDIFAGLGSMIGTLGYGGSSSALGINRMAMAVLRGDYRLLRPVRGIVNPAFEKAKATGYNVGTPGFNEKFIEELGKIPAIMDLALKRSESVAGLWSTIHGLAQEFWMDFTGAGEERGVLTFWSQIKDILLEIRNNSLIMYEKLQPFFQEMGTFVGSGFKVFYEVLKAILTIFSPILSILKEVLRIVFQIGIFLSQTLVKGIKFLMDSLNKLMDFFGNNSLIKKMIDILSDFVIGLQVSFKFWGVYVDWIFDKLSKKLDELIAKYRPIIDFIGNVSKIAYQGTPVGRINEIGKMIPDEEKARNKALLDKGLEWAKDKTVGPGSFVDMLLRANQNAAYGFGIVGDKLLKEMKEINSTLKNGTMTIAPKKQVISPAAATGNANK